VGGSFAVVTVRLAVFLVRARDHLRPVLRRRRLRQLASAARARVPPALSTLRPPDRERPRLPMALLRLAGAVAAAAIATSVVLYVFGSAAVRAAVDLVG
jgi:hypothetical protein